MRSGLFNVRLSGLCDMGAAYLAMAVISVPLCSATLKAVSEYSYSSVVVQSANSSLAILSHKTWGMTATLPGDITRVTFTTVSKSTTPGMKNPFTPLLFGDLWVGKLELGHGSSIVCASASPMIQRKKKSRRAGRRRVWEIGPQHDFNLATCLHSVLPPWQTVGTESQRSETEEDVSGSVFYHYGVETPLGRCLCSFDLKASSKG